MATASRLDLSCTKYLHHPRAGNLTLIVLNRTAPSPSPLAATARPSVCPSPSRRSLSFIRLAQNSLGLLSFKRGIGHLRCHGSARSGLLGRQRLASKLGPAN